MDFMDRELVIISPETVEEKTEKILKDVN